MKTKTMTSALSAGLPIKLHLAAAALILGLLAIPHIGHSQGIVRGAQEDAYEGNRVAGPVGGVVGGAVGAGVTRVALETPACTTPAMAPAAAKTWQQFKSVPPLDDTGKKYQ